MQSEREPLWRIEDVAEYLAVPVHDVHKMVAQRSIPHFKIGEYLRFRRSDIDQWLDGLAVRCLDRAPRPVALPVVSHEVSIRSHGLPLEVSSPVPSSTPQLRVPSAPHSPQQPSDPIQVRAAAALEESGLGDQNLQKLVQKLGETNGFRVTVNQQVPGGHTSVDVVLERDGWRLACEISVTSNLEQEIGSIRKCLASGFHEVAMVLPNQRQARKLENALSNTLTKEELARVKLLAPEELPGYVEGIETLVAEREETILGYRVKVRYVRTNPADEARRQKALVRVFAESLLRRRIAPEAD